MDDAASDGGDRPVKTWDEIRRKKKRNRHSVTIATDPQVAKRWLELKSELDLAELRLKQEGDNPDALTDRDEAQQRLDEFRPLLDEESVTFVFESLPRHEYEKLVQAHPPSGDQIKEARKTGQLRRNQTLPFNLETFPPALIAACVKEPVMSEGEVMEMWNGSDWGVSELSQIYEAAMTANNSHPDVNVPLGSRGTRSSD